MMTTPVENVIRAGSGIPDRAVPVLARYVELLATDEGSEAELNALLLRPEFDGIPQVKARSLRLALMNWRALLLDGVPELVSLALNAVKLDWASAVLDGLKLARALKANAEVDLTKDQAMVVKALWIDNWYVNPVPRNLVKSSLDNTPLQVPLENLLDDLAILGVIDFNEESIGKRDKLILKA